MVKAVRLNRYLAESGLGSRRKVETLILSGKIKVNGRVVTELATRIDPVKDLVEAEGTIVKINSKKVYLLLNKPRGYVVTRKDEFDRKTVYKLLPDFAAACVPAGRLDLDSEGLLLITNDGDLVQALTHPTNKIDKTYQVEIDLPLNQRQLDNLRKGVVIDGYKTRPAGVFVKGTGREATSLKVVISEGKKRQIRLMLEAVGRKVIKLKRNQIGDLELGKLPSGMWRECSRSEIRYLMSLKQEQK